ncbi:putative uncharacterized protein DDB_G0277255 [Hyalella azteca]|uniref:C2H2-type domain-containing protein n=1 Tax=Hyalella azteca TaxID=294128 RepID=A0A8B7NNX5_HYAAZ|nr:putative uncharacterized protein DDB_G0277255 [Hyalella azteca]
MDADRTMEQMSHSTSTEFLSLEHMDAAGASSPGSSMLLVAADASCLPTTMNSSSSAEGSYMEGLVCSSSDPPDEHHFLNTDALDQLTGSLLEVRAPLHLQFDSTNSSSVQRLSYIPSSSGPASISLVNSDANFSVASTGNNVSASGNTVPSSSLLNAFSFIDAKGNPITGNVVIEDGNIVIQDQTSGHNSEIFLNIPCSDSEQNSILNISCLDSRPKNASISCFDTQQGTLLSNINSSVAQENNLENIHCSETLQNTLLKNLDNSQEDSQSISSAVGLRDIGTASLGLVDQSNLILNSFPGGNQLNLYGDQASGLNHTSFILRNDLVTHPVVSDSSILLPLSHALDSGQSQVLLGSINNGQSFCLLSDSLADSDGGNALLAQSSESQSHSYLLNNQSSVSQTQSLEPNSRASVQLSQSFLHNSQSSGMQTHFLELQGSSSDLMLSGSSVGALHSVLEGPNTLMLDNNLLDNDNNQHEHDEKNIFKKNHCSDQGYRNLTGNESPLAGQILMVHSNGTHSIVVDTPAAQTSGVQPLSLQSSSDKLLRPSSQQPQTPRKTIHILPLKKTYNNNSNNNAFFVTNSTSNNNTNNNNNISTSRHNNNSFRVVSSIAGRSKVISSNNSNIRVNSNHVSGGSISNTNIINNSSNKCVISNNNSSYTGVHVKGVEEGALVLLAAPHEANRPPSLLDHNEQLGDQASPVAPAGPYRCPRCPAVVRAYSKYRKHLLAHRQDKPFACAVCGDAFNRQENLSLHEGLHGPGPPFTCPRCDKTFRRLASYRAHLPLHLLDETVACPACGEEFVSTLELPEHERLIHGGLSSTPGGLTPTIKSEPPDPAFCDTKPCLQTHTAPQGLGLTEKNPNHVIKCEGPGNKSGVPWGVPGVPWGSVDQENSDPENLGPEFSLNSDPEFRGQLLLPPKLEGDEGEGIVVVGEEFSMEGEEEGEVMRLLEEVVQRRYSCDACSASFVSPRLLDQHRVLHRTAKKLSRPKARRRRRYRSLVGSPPRGGAGRGRVGHRCTTCSKLFDKPSQLLRHLRIHTGEKPFKVGHEGEKPFKVGRVGEKPFKVGHEGEKPFKVGHEGEKPFKVGHEGEKPFKVGE